MKKSVTHTTKDGASVHGMPSLHVVCLVCCLLSLYLFVYVVEMSLPCSFMIAKQFIILELLKIPCLAHMGWETIRLGACLPSWQIYRRFYADHHAIVLVRSVGDDGGSAVVSWLDSRLTWRPCPTVDVVFLLPAEAGALPGGGVSRRHFRWRPRVPWRLPEFVSLLPDVRWGWEAGGSILSSPARR